MAIRGMGNLWPPDRAGSSLPPCHQGLGQLGCGLERALQSKGRSRGRAGATCAERGLMDPGRDSAFSGYLVSSPQRQEFRPVLGLILIFIQNLKMPAKCGRCWGTWHLLPALLSLVWLWSHCCPSAEGGLPPGPSCWARSLMLPQGGLARRHLGEGQGESKGSRWARRA